MPYHKYEADRQDEQVLTCEVCQQVKEYTTDHPPKGWVVIWGAGGEGTNQGTECYCPDHAQEGRARKAAR